MNLTSIHNLNEKASAFIYSFWQWRNSSWGAVYDVSKTVQACLSNQIHAFEFVAVESDSAIEQHVGGLILSSVLRREDVLLVARVGRYRASNGFSAWDASPQYLKRVVEQLLSSLCTDHLDILLLEGSDFLTPVEESAFALNQLVDEGKVRALGLSHMPVNRQEQFVRMLGDRVICSQLKMNLLDPTPLFDGRFDYAKQYFIRPMVTSPLAAGFLSSSHSSHAILLREELRRLAILYQASWEQIALAWLLQLDTLLVLGTLSERLFHEAILARRIRLSHDDWYRLLGMAQIELSFPNPLEP